MNTIHIIGTVRPDTEENALRQLDALIHEIESPTILYHGDDHTSYMLRKYAQHDKLPMLRDMDTDPPRLYARHLSAKHLVIIGYPIADGLKAWRKRSSFDRPPLTAVILPNDDQPPPHENAQILCTGKKSISRQRRRLPR